MSPEDGRQVDRGVPFPYPEGRFPRRLGAVIQQTVLDGSEPARMVVHDAENDWLVGDGVNNPNEHGACVIGHIVHVSDADPTVAELASMGIGLVATRSDPHSPWQIDPHEWAEE